ncbi:MAG: hypothetical protein PsegKO_23390 [Pseudohongiellaceae bacterium]
MGPDGNHGGEVPILTLPCHKHQTTPQTLKISPTEQFSRSLIPDIMVILGMQTLSVVQDWAWVARRSQTQQLSQ